MQQNSYSTLCFMCDNGDIFDNCKSLYMKSQNHTNKKGIFMIFEK